MTWPYGEFVLDLEPQGPLPPQVYWRRRGLALGIAALAIALVAGIAFALFGGSDAAKNTANETTQTPQPENKTPVVESAESSAAPTPTPTAAAELAVQPREVWLGTLDAIGERVQDAAFRQLDEQAQRLDRLAAHLGRKVGWGGGGRLALWCG